MDLSARAASSRALRRMGDGSTAKILNAYQVLQTKESARCSRALFFIVCFAKSGSGGVEHLV